MRLKIRCDGESEKFCKIFWELNKALVNSSTSDALWDFRRPIIFFFLPHEIWFMCTLCLYRIQIQTSMIYILSHVMLRALIDSISIVVDKTGSNIFILTVALVVVILPSFLLIIIPCSVRLGCQRGRRIPRLVCSMSPAGDPSSAARRNPTK